MCVRGGDMSKIKQIKYGINGTIIIRSKILNILLECQKRKKQNKWETKNKKELNSFAYSFIDNKFFKKYLCVTYVGVICSHVVIH